MKIFRKIRQQFLTDNKISKYFLYAIGEIVLVVIGILIALNINNWNEEQSKRDAELNFYQNTKLQLLDDLNNIESNIQYNNEYTKQFRYAVNPTIDGLRNTMLYRTFIHEVGDYVDYLEKIERPSRNDFDYDFWADYDKIPSQEKENFAHSYAKKVTNELTKKGVIPFNRILNKKTIESEKLDVSDFILT